MNFNKAFFLRNEDRAPQWKLIDAQDKVLGRLATEIANALRGKNKPSYTPHVDTGDYIIVVNAEKVKLTGDKLKDKQYARYTGWMGGYKTLAAHELMKKHPTKLIEYAVRGMLPKNKLSRKIMKNKLKVYVGKHHPHSAQLSSKL